MKVGDAVPDVKATLDNGETVSLARLGKPLVLFFYPKAFSPVCTKEACHFRDVTADFAKFGAVVYGVAPDDQATLGRFKTEHHLPYPLISDPEKKLAAAFGAVGLFGMMNRVTVVADSAGKILLVYSNILNPGAHSVKALEALGSGS